MKKLLFLGKKNKESNCRGFLNALIGSNYQVLDIDQADVMSKLHDVMLFAPDYILIFKGIALDVAFLEYCKTNLPNTKIIYNFIDALTFNRGGFAKYMSISKISDLTLTASMQGYNYFKQHQPNTHLFHQAAEDIFIDSIKTKPSERPLDILYFGSMSPERNKAITHLKNYCRLEKYSLSLFGAGLGTKLDKQGIINEVNKHKIVLNLTFDHRYDYISVRVFNVLAVKTCLLTFRCSEIINQYINRNEEYVGSYMSGSELMHKIDYYMNNLNVVDDLAEKSYKHTLDNHTWMNRIVQFNGLLDKLNGE